MRPEKTSLTAHRYNLPSPVACSVMSVSHHRFGPDAVKSRFTRSSWPGGRTLTFLPRPRRLPNALHQRLSRQIFQAVRSDIASPAARASSARKRWPNSGSSR